MAEPDIRCIQRLNLNSQFLASHTYNEEIARQVASAIVNQYFPEFVRLHATLTMLKGDAS